MSFRSLIFDHIWLKFFSVVLAILIWLAVRANLGTEPVLPHRLGSDIEKSFLSSPILVLTESGDRTPVTLPPRPANVIVRGPADLINGLKNEDISVFVRLNERAPNAGSLDLPVHVHVPPGARVFLVAP